jgi:hypothetical protein
MLGTKKTIILKHNLRIIIVFMKATNDFFSEKRIDIGRNSVKVKIIYIARKKLLQTLSSACQTAMTLYLEELWHSWLERQH